MKELHTLEENNDTFIGSFFYEFPKDEKKVAKCTVQKLLTADSYPLIPSSFQLVPSLNRKFGFVHFEFPSSLNEHSLDGEDLFSTSYRTSNAFIRVRSLMSLLIKEASRETNVSTISKTVSYVWNRCGKWARYYFQYIASLEAEIRAVHESKVFIVKLKNSYSFSNWFSSYRRSLKAFQKVPVVTKFKISKERYKIRKPNAALKTCKNLRSRISIVLGIVAEDVFLNSKLSR